MMGKTEENLKEAFSGESQANRKYLAFAQRAADEYKEGIYKLFMAVAEAETIHAHRHLSHLKGIKNTKENFARNSPRWSQSWWQDASVIIADVVRVAMLEINRISAFLCTDSHDVMPVSYIRQYISKIIPLWHTFLYAMARNPVLDRYFLQEGGSYFQWKETRCTRS